MTKLSLIERPDNDVVLDFDLNELKLDESYVNYFSDDPNLQVFQLPRECLKCSYEKKIIYGGYFVSRSSLIKYRVQDVMSNNVICDIDEDFGEFGVYNLTVNNNTCSITTVQEPVSIYFPILTAILIYGFLCSLIYCIIRFGKFSKKEKNETKKPRIQSLDTFRGISISMMIFANYGCGGYEICEHAVWNGLHIADVIFPWFMWIMGVCIPISITSQLKKDIPKTTIVLTALKRAIKLFLVGLFLNTSTGLDNMRIFGVLQRFAIGYFAVTIIFLFCVKQTPIGGRYKYIKDRAKLVYAWMVIFCILAIYLAIIFSVTEDDCPRGYFGPGGKHEYGKYNGCTGGATGAIDRAILGQHLYRYATIIYVFKNNQLFDPEGILGCLPTIIHAFIGLQAGIISMTYKSHKERLIRWLLWGVILGLVGGGLSGFSKDDGAIPVNKNLWSLSFVFVTCSLAYILLSICYILVDMLKIWNGKPFLFAGMNSIFMYIGHSLSGNNFPVRWSVKGDAPPATHFIYLVENIWATGFWISVSYYLYRIDYYFTL